MILRQTWAIFVDAYRELNARKLFWITLGLSLLAVAAFGMVGLNDRGYTFLVWTFPSEVFNSRAFPPAEFYAYIFTEYGVKLWLAWIAIILALISTASMIPDMIAAGSIELVIARPMSRIRLFLTKYLAALLFVFLQVLVFSGAVFLVFGIRGGAWVPGLLLAVPIVTVFFSYLFGVCALFGMITKSPIAALLMTLLVWFFTFALNVTEIGLLAQRTKSELSVARHEQVLALVRPKVKEARQELDVMRARVDAGELPKDDSDFTKLTSRVTSGLNFVQSVQSGLADAREDADSMRTWHSVFYKIKYVLPKTVETKDLLVRWLVDAAHLPKGPVGDTETDEQLESILGAEGPVAGSKKDQPPRPRSTAVPPQDIVEAVQARLSGRSITWVIGTSLGFEAVCLGLATWIFRRRDF